MWSLCCSLPLDSVLVSYSPLKQVFSPSLFLHKYKILSGFLFVCGNRSAIIWTIYTVLDSKHYKVNTAIRDLSSKGENLCKIVKKKKTKQVIVCRMVMYEVQLTQVTSKPSRFLLVSAASSHDRLEYEWNLLRGTFPLSGGLLIVWKLVSATIKLFKRLLRLFLHLQVYVLQFWIYNTQVWEIKSFDILMPGNWRSVS